MPAEKEIQDFKRAFSLGSGSAVLADEVEGESFIPDPNDPDAAADEIRFEEGIEKRMSMEQAMEIRGITPAANAPVLSTPEPIAAPDTEIPAEKGSREWALTLVSQDRGPTEVETGGEISSEVAGLRQELAVANARAEERQRQRTEEDAEDARLADDDTDDDPEEFSTDFYTSPKVIQQIAESYNITEEEARSRAQLSGVMIQHYHTNFIEPERERQRAAQDDRHRVVMNAENERETLGNFEAAKNHLSQTGQELELVLVEQLMKWGMDDSHLGRYLSKNNNRFMATHPDSVIDAAKTVARQVVALAEEVDTGINRQSKRAPVGEQKYASIGRAVRRDRSTQQANAPNPDSALRAAIRNAGRPALPALMGRG